MCLQAHRWNTETMFGFGRKKGNESPSSHGVSTHGASDTSSISDATSSSSQRFCARGWAHQHNDAGLSLRLARLGAADGAPPPPSAPPRPVRGVSHRIKDGSGRARAWLRACGGAHGGRQQGGPRRRPAATRRAKAPRRPSPR